MRVELAPHDDKVSITIIAEDEADKRTIESSLKHVGVQPAEWAGSNTPAQIKAQIIFITDLF